MKNQLTLKTTSLKKKWDAGNYHKNSSIQFEASKRILDELHFKGNENILDIGCGDGKITARISTYGPNGKTLGIDLSPQMIQFAKSNYTSETYMNLSFEKIDANKIKFQNEFDILFSSFALQWVITDIEQFRNPISRFISRVNFSPCSLTT